MPMLPLRAGDSNRADVASIAASLLAARGDAITTAVGSVVWIEVQAHARAIYGIWAANAKLRNQFDPRTMTDFIGRWEKILYLSPLPTDTLDDRRNRIAAKFLQLGAYPNTQSTIDLLTTALPQIFVGLINNSASALSNTTFPGGYNIIGGPLALNGPWYGESAQIAVETHQPQSMTDAQFGAYTQQITSLLASFFPSWTTFDWFNNQFTDNGTAGGLGLITGTAGSTTINSVSTIWAHTINSTDSIKSLMPDSQIEFFDDLGQWRRAHVVSVVSNTQCTIQLPLAASVTGLRYWISGFYYDCDPTQAPYPPAGIHNLDQAGLYP